MWTVPLAWRGRRSRLDARTGRGTGRDLDHQASREWRNACPRTAAFGPVRDNGHAGCHPDRSSPGGGVVMERLRVLIADDHPLFREGLHGLLDSLAETEVVGEATTGAEAITQAKALQP